MSTKAIRVALKALATFDGVDGDPMTILTEPATKELEAIRQAARALVEWNRNGQRQDLDAARAWRVIEAIAKEGP